MVAMIGSQLSRKENRPMKCKQCNGDGWYADHSESHYRNGNNPDDCYKYGCPIQVQCADCLGTGEIKEETTDENGNIKEVV